MIDDESLPRLYRKAFTTKDSGLLLILVDQSEQMARADWAKQAADAANDLMIEAIRSCRVEAEVKRRLQIGVVGYGSRVAPVVGGWIDELNEKPLAMVALERDIMTAEGRLTKVREDKPIWVAPIAAGGAPMAEALELASRIGEAWAKTHPESFPPVVVNISRGAPNDFVPDLNDTHFGSAPGTEQAARHLTEIATGDGNLLLFNVCIGDRNLQQVLPADLEGISHPFARLLFRLSSDLPAHLLQEARQSGFGVKDGARCFLSRTDAGIIAKMLPFDPDEIWHGG